MKKSAKPETKKTTPKFEVGTIVTMPALVTDSNGIAWWVDPLAHYIKQVKT